MFILASASPRRILLLRQWKLEFTVRPAQIDETAIANQLPEVLPGEVALALARAKACSVSVGFPDRYVLGVDTLVALGTEILGKPSNAEDAVQMLRLQSGRRQKVYSGLSFFRAGLEVACGIESSIVKMRRLTDDMITAYVSKEQPLDKAGAYAIQEGAQSFIEYYEGCYLNIVGMPLCRLRDIVQKSDIGIVMPEAVPNACANRGRIYL